MLNIIDLIMVNTYFKLAVLPIITFLKENVVIGLLKNIQITIIIGFLQR